MDRSLAQCQKYINADLPRLLAELNELSVRTKTSSDSQRNRSKENHPSNSLLRSSSN